jgi:predicted SprT family Zn-dependent metalloprotease
MTSEALQEAREEVDACYRQFPDLATVPRSCVHVGIARWRRKNGTCYYNKRPTRNEIWNKRVTGLERTDSEHTVVVNARVYEQDNLHGFVDTVRHELAHAWTYGRLGHSDGHGSEWKEIARKIGADPSSCHNKKDTDGKYVYGCPECLWWKNYHRRSKKIKHPGRYVCKECGTKMASAYQPSGLEAGVCNVDW